MYHKYNHIVDDTCMSIKGYNLWPLILHPQKASIAIATIAYLISKPYGNIWQQLVPLTPHPTQWSPTFCCHKKTHHGHDDFFRTGDLKWQNLIFRSSLGVTWYQQPLSGSGSRKTQPSLTKVTAAESPGVFLVFGGGKTWKTNKLSWRIHGQNGFCIAAAFG